MSDAIRCPSCGASNAADAAWCGQCFARFPSPPHAPEPATGAVPHPAPAEAAAVPHPAPAEAAAVPQPAPGQAAAVPHPAPGRAAPAPQPHLSVVPQTGVHRAGDRLVWTCPACESVNEMDHTLCPVCATPIASLFGAEPAGPVKRTGGRVVALSAALPGLGHGYAGRFGDAIARGVLFAWTLSVGVFLLTRTASRGAGIFRGVGAVFVLAAVGTWILSLLEAQRLSRGDASSVVSGRTLMWTTAALTGVLFFGLAVAAQTR